ncbi:OLC1v1017425C1 [Oldenlandia corymbosa var. corymbosa]|uniref:OLC1v1017425C1 n=1 Tax=Oldenlandia corymbosa var. corymbosa TaxID=529605 RepID=A0AAV1E9E6_OLDCO|nr:OLC1v1017425C1 [Oldenlandia corymbosa var. corymbosa]
MVSFHTPLSPKRKIAPRLENLLKKRKLGDHDDHGDNTNQAAAAADDDQSVMMMKSSKADTELHLEPRIPQEWQRCLDIKSGQIYFYNTRTKQRMLDNPESQPQPPTPPRQNHMSLDLELNLPCGSSSTSSSAKNQANNPSTDNHHHHQHQQQPILMGSAAVANNNSTPGKRLTRAPSWLTFEEGEEEMVAAACRKCHMLVMMCKSSPSCPNCKFLHPPELSNSPTLLKRRLSLLC